MEHKEMSPRHYELLKCLTCLPHKILSLHGRDNVTEFVLHDLCNEECFNLAKAAYFVDNPDFDCFKGIAGYDRSEDKSDKNCRWQQPDQFTNYTSNCNFNQKVRNIVKPSKKKLNHAEAEILAEIAFELNMHNPSLYVWQMKHENHGMLIYERIAGDTTELDQETLKGICLLAFCPIF